MAQTHKVSDVMTDADFEKALDELREQDESGEVNELLSKFSLPNLHLTVLNIYKRERVNSVF